MIEREHKYDVDGDQPVPDLTVVGGVARVGEPVEHRLEATYFDTPDLRLARSGVTLRRRAGGTDEGWHLKLPSAEQIDARHELRVGLIGAAGTVPGRFRATVAGLVGEQSLSAVATITTRRTVLRLYGEDGSVLAELADDRVEARRLGTDQADEPSTWRELEIELVHADPGLLEDVGACLTEAGASRSHRVSKLSTVLAPPTRAAAPTRVRGSVSELVLHQLVTHLDALRAHDPLVREHLPEGVHKMRVASRRLRSALATCRPFLDRSVTDPLRDELAWLGDALGDARDAEVMRSRLAAALDTLVHDRPGVDWEPGRVRPALSETLDIRDDDAQSALAELLAGERYRQLLDRLTQLVATPPWREKAHQRVGAAYLPRVQHELDRLDARMKQAVDLEHADRDTALHDARKAAKRARYATEPLVPVYGAPAAKLVKRLKKLQSRLGQHQDTVVTRAYLTDLARSTSPGLEPQAALAAGALLERESRAAEAYDERARDAWRRVRRTTLPR